MAAPAIAEAITAGPQDDGKKVFVGNLKPNSTDEELRNIFSGHGTVTHAQIIKKRYGRPPRYGFVTFSSEQEATAAISSFNQKTVDDLILNVEIAKPPASKPAGNIAKEAAAAAGGPEPPVTEGRGRSKRGRGRGRARGRGKGRRSAPADGEADAAPADSEKGAVLNGESAAAAEGAEGADGAQRGRGRGRGRGGRTLRRGPPSGEPSKTLLFVANLPFDLDNEGLKKIFETYNVANAHVVVRKKGPVTGRSKGFGFVELVNEDEQKKVLADFKDGKEIEGRIVQVKIAIEPDESAEPSTGNAPQAEAAVENKQA